MTLTIHTRIFIGLVVTATALPATAQLTRRSSDEIERKLDGDESTDRALQPRFDNKKAAAEQAAQWLLGSSGPGGVYPEGSWIWDQPVSLIQRDGEWYMNINQDDMFVAILPNSTLQKLQTYALSGKDLGFIVTAMVTEYKGRNLALLEDFTIVAATKPPATKPAEAPGSSTQSNNSADDIRSSMRDAKPREIVQDGEEIVLDKPVAADSKLIPEGTRLVDRVGRLVQEVDAWTIAFESGSEQPDQAPLAVLPNRALQEMEVLSAGGGKIRFSADVTEFQGVNYLLIRRFVLVRDYGNLQ